MSKITRCDRCGADILQAAHVLYLTITRMNHQPGGVDLCRECQAQFELFMAQTGQQYRLPDRTDS